MNVEDIPAFPVADVYHPNGQIQFGSSGMTLRDYFAAQVVAGIDQRSNGSPMDVAEEAYQLADAMLSVRSRKDAKP